MIKKFSKFHDDKRKFNSRPNKSYNIDNKIVWESRSPALVGVIIANYNNDDYVLIGERGKGSADYQGKWNVPCGYLDWDENGTNGVYREIYEETGVYIPSILENDEILKNNMEQPFHVNTSTNSNRQNVSLSYGLYFKTDNLPELTDENSEPDEVGDIRWVKIKDIDKYDFAFDHNDRIMSYYNSVK